MSREGTYFVRSSNQCLTRKLNGKKIKFNGKQERLRGHCFMRSVRERTANCCFHPAAPKKTFSYHCDGKDKVPRLAFH